MMEAMMMAQPIPIHGSRITMEAVLLTPELAAQYLAASKGNRSIRKRKVKTYVRVIEDNLWRLTHEGIAFDIHGTLVDGHHRCHAVVDSGIPIRVLVFRGIDPDAVSAMNTGLPRSNTDIMRSYAGNLDTLGLELTYTGARIVSLAASSAVRYAKSEATATPDDVSRFMQRYAAGVRWLVETCRTCPAKLGSGRLYLCFICAYELAPQTVSMMWEQLVTGANLRPGSGMLALREYLYGETTAGHGRSIIKSDSETLKLSKTAAAIMADIEGRRIKSLRGNAVTVERLLGSKQDMAERLWLEVEHGKQAMPEPPWATRANR